MKTKLESLNGFSANDIVMANGKGTIVTHEYKNTQGKSASDRVTDFYL